MDMVEFLESKGMSSDGINRILRYVFNRKEDVNYLELLNKIYEIMNYAGLNDDQIEILICNNINILELEYSEIVKIAYILQDIGLVDEIFEKRSVYQKAMTNYKKMFIRNFIAKHGGRYLKTNSPAFLTDSDLNTYGEKYGLCVSAYQIFHKNIFSDEEAEKELNKILCIKNINNTEQKNVTVDDFINNKSKIFYSTFLLYKHNKKYSNNGVSK